MRAAARDPDFMSTTSYGRLFNTAQNKRSFRRVDIERQQDVLGTVDGEVARGTLIGHDLLYKEYS